MAEARVAAKDDLATSVGMVVLIGSLAMVFVSLLFSHSLLRERGWGEAPLPVGLASVSTVLAVLASLALRLRSARLASLAGLALSMGFVACQLLVWRECIVRGLWPDESRLASSVFALTGLHALHVVVGIFGLSRCFWRGGAELRWWRWYWDFLVLVWAVIFAVVFLG